MVVLRARFLPLAASLFLVSCGLLPKDTVQATTTLVKKERHPHIHHAIEELREARKELETADHDFGGHRADAIKSVDHSIRQLEKALKFAK